MKTNKEQIEYIIGRKYHCSWAKSRGYVWKLLFFNKDKNEAILQTPKTKKRLITQLSSLRNINFYEIKLNQLKKCTE